MADHDGDIPVTIHLGELEKDYPGLLTGAREFFAQGALEVAYVFSCLDHKIAVVVLAPKGLDPTAEHYRCAKQMIVKLALKTGAIGVLPLHVQVDVVRDDRAPQPPPDGTIH